ncbi:two-component sensor histidine kinase, partial [Streptomyces virginiae]
GGVAGGGGRAPPARPAPGGGPAARRADDGPGTLTAAGPEATWPDPAGPEPAAPGPDGRRTAEVLTLGFGLAALSALMVVGIAFVYAAQPSGRSGPAPLPRVGMTYAEVAGYGVLDNAAVRAAASGHEPPRPAGTAGCVYPFNGATERHPGGLLIARYCFDAAQRLIAIDRFDVPSVRDATPWETP